MFNLLRGSKSKEGDENGISIDATDIKSLLVKEYERSKQIEEENQALKQTIEDYKEKEIEYRAAMVTIDEYERRTRNLKYDVEKVESRIKQKDGKIEKITEELNTLKINYRSLTEKSRSLIDTERQQEASRIKKVMLDDLKISVGNWSKKRVVSFVEEHLKVRAE